MIFSRFLHTDDITFNQLPLWNNFPTNFNRKHLHSTLNPQHQNWVSRRAFQSKVPSTLITHLQCHQFSSWKSKVPTLRIFMIALGTKRSKLSRSSPRNVIVINVCIDKLHSGDFGIEIRHVNGQLSSSSSASLFNHWPFIFESRLVRDQNSEFASRSAPGRRSILSGSSRHENSMFDSSRCDAKTESLWVVVDAQAYPAWMIRFIIR